MTTTTTTMTTTTTTHLPSQIVRVDDAVAVAVGKVCDGAAACEVHPHLDDAVLDELHRRRHTHDTQCHNHDGKAQWHRGHRLTEAGHRHGRDRHSRQESRLTPNSPSI
jgi:hypothetical protein